MSPALIFRDRRVNLCCSAMHNCNARLTLKTIRIYWPRIKLKTIRERKLTAPVDIRRVGHYRHSKTFLRDTWSKNTGEFNLIFVYNKLVHALAYRLAKENNSNLLMAKASESPSSVASVAYPKSPSSSNSSTPDKNSSNSSSSFP